VASGIQYSIPIARPYLTGKEGPRIAEVLASGWVSQGPTVKQFEDAICEVTGAPYGIATTSCTTALHLLMLLYGIGAGDEVLCPSYSFIASANGIRHSGAEAQFVDIDPNTLNIDPKAAEAVITSCYSKDLNNLQTGRRLKAIMLVHQVGIPADIDAFTVLAKQYGLEIIEDAACAIGSTYKGQPIGSSGYSCALSFHPRKVITSGEGGMILTHSNEIAERARVLRAHGASTSDFARHGSAVTSYESYDVVGYNYRMTDMQAALGLCQLESLDWLTSRRREIGARYNAAFGKLADLEVINPPDYVTKWNYQSYPLRLVEDNAERRNKIMERLQDNGIATRRGIPPIHKEPCYSGAASLLPHTESVSRRSFFLPIFAQLSDDEVTHIIDSVTKAVREK
jgi:perosamine synthetase